MSFVKFAVFTSILLFSFVSAQRFCGLADRASGLIRNGTITTRGKWPWLTALVRSESNQFFCAATLISNRHLLTAAHCMQPKTQITPIRSNEFMAQLGRYELSKAYERGVQVAHPLKVHIHPDWNYDTENYDADLSIILLRRNVAFSFSTSPVCFWRSDEMLLATNGIVVGWVK